MEDFCQIYLRTHNSSLGERVFTIALVTVDCFYQDPSPVGGSELCSALLTVYDSSPVSGGVTTKEQQQHQLVGSALASLLAASTTAKHTALKGTNVVHFLFVCVRGCEGVCCCMVVSWVVGVMCGAPQDTAL